MSKYIPKRLLGSTLFKHNLLTFSYLCFVRLSPVRYTLDMNYAGDQIVNRTVSCTATDTGQNFIIGCRYFFKKAQAVSNYRYESKILSSLPVLFLPLPFCYLVIFKSLVFVLYIRCWFNIFLFLVLYGALGLLLWLESKKKGERKSVNTDGSSVSKVEDWHFGKVSNYGCNGPCSNPT